MGNEGVAVLPVFTAGDVDAHRFPGNVLVFEAAQLTDAQAGGIQDGKHGFLFQVRDGGDEGPHFLSGRDIGKISIELPGGELVRVPWLVEDIQGEKAQLCNGGVDGPVRKGAGPLEMGNVVPQLLPGDLFRPLAKEGVKIFKIGADVGAVGAHRVVGQPAKGDHLPISVKICLHKKPPKGVLLQKRTKETPCGRRPDAEKRK